HALALDLHHAGAAIAVGAVAGLWRVAQMRDLGAFALGDLPDGLAFASDDFAAVEHEGDGLGAIGGAGHGVDRPLAADAWLALRNGRAASGTFLVVTVAFRLLSAAVAHRITICPRASSARPENISARRSADSAPPGRDRRSRHRIAVESSSSSPVFHGPCAISFTAFSVPTRHGVHWPQL